MDEMKPCPFCGSKNVDVMHTVGKVHVLCLDCLSKGPLIKVTRVSIDTLDAAAKMAWNHRE